MAQRKHLDDFYVVELLDDWNGDVPSWKYPRNLESPRVLSTGFGNDSKMMVIPKTLQSPTENSLAVLNHKILEANSQVQNVKLGGHQTCLSINRLWHELCDMLRRLNGTTAPGHHDCSIQG
ncbi:uncharacterized protein TNCV_1268061 [Trichonephila clavipes]|nr:uncharacterized protein TNCV_1268061 [Trichonephila clavipes]